jgi:hypothetical protein
VTAVTPAPASRLDKALAFIPRALSSHAHVLALGALGLYLVILPLLSVNVSAKAELIGGNYCNVTSDIGACIAAGGTVTLLRHSRKRNRLAEATHRITADLYRFHTGQAHPDAPQPGGAAGDPQV